MLGTVSDRMPPPRAFFDAMTKVAAEPTAALLTRAIAEVKRKSPSAGLLRAEYALDSFDPSGIARAYERAGAAAISCLTDEPHFGGDLGFIQQIRSVCDLPVLRKDFIIDEYQVVESRAAGADALLLMAECLEGSALDAMAHQAISLGLSVLVEIHDEDNLDRAASLVEGINASREPGTAGALLGINNRNLRSMVVDLGHTLRLAARLSVAMRAVVVGESGIKTNEDIVRLHGAGINKILVGESLMKQPRPGEALAALLATPGQGTNESHA